MGDADKVALSYPHLARDMVPGNTILMSDGAVMLEVVECHTDKGEARACFVRVRKGAGRARGGDPRVRRRGESTVGRVRAPLPRAAGALQVPQLLQARRAQELQPPGRGRRPPDPHG